MLISANRSLKNSLSPRAPSGAWIQGRVATTLEFGEFQRWVGMIPVHGGPPRSNHMQRRNLGSLAAAPPQYQRWANRVSRLPPPGPLGYPCALPYIQPLTQILLSSYFCRTCPSSEELGFRVLCLPLNICYLLGLWKEHFSLGTYPPTLHIAPPCLHLIRMCHPGGHR